MFIAIVYADDLNAFKVYKRSTPTEAILSDIGEVQADLHRWGRANQIAFDPGKESKHILCKQHPYGNSFKILGIVFDTKLLVTKAVDDVLNNVRWRVAILNRIKHMYDGVPSDIVGI